MIIGHGDDIYSQDNKIVWNFSSNVDTHQDLSALRAYITTCIHQIHSYPEPDAGSLARVLAEKNGVNQTNLAITNGATEAIYLIAQAFAQAKTAIIIPTFSEYEDACRINQHQLSYYSHLSEVHEELDLIWLCNPNNPTGYTYSKEYLLKFINLHPKTVFVIDQSYEHFCREELFTMLDSKSISNLILLHSMTKHFAIPGLRLGYLSSSENLINKINYFRMPWAVNQLAIEAGKFLETQYDNLVDVEKLLENAHILKKELAKMDELEVSPTTTHFFMCCIKDKHRTAQDLKEFLVKNYGILIRDASNFRGLTPQHFRVAAQNKEANNVLIKAIKEWIS